MQNGTLDLNGKEPVFTAHDPDMLLSKICNVEYNPTASCKEWEKFLLEIMQDDTQKSSICKNSRAVIDGKHAGRNLLHFVRKYNTKRKIYTMRDPYIFVGRLCSYDEAGKSCCKAEY